MAGAGWGRPLLPGFLQDPCTQVSQSGFPKGRELDSVSRQEDQERARPGPDGPVRRDRARLPVPCWGGRGPEGRTLRPLSLHTQQGFSRLNALSTSSQKDQGHAPRPRPQSQKQALNQSPTPGAARLALPAASQRGFSSSPPPWPRVQALLLSPTALHWPRLFPLPEAASLFYSAWGREGLGTWVGSIASRPQ